MKKYDVAVVGGGFAGFAAALSASRGGASVILIDKSNCPGGIAVNALVNPFMRNRTTAEGKKLDLSAGIFLEILGKTEERQAMWHECFPEEELKALLNDMAEKAGIALAVRDKTDTQSIDINELRSTLTQNGAFIG